MKISIITVCYNAEKTIADAMESVLTQRHGDTEIEYIVVDGGSTDGTVDEVKRKSEKVKSKDGFSFKWVSEKDRGMYDALNKGMRMATGEVIGILNADDVLAEEDTLARIVRLFDCSDCSIDGCYGDIRFVREGVERVAGVEKVEKVEGVEKVERVERVEGVEGVEKVEGVEGVERLRGLRTVRYCSGKWFRPWMFRFGTQTAHPSTFFRKECFEKWGEYSLDYGMYGDFELLCRFIWKHRARMKYLPICTTVMRMGGASTNGWRTTLKINRSDLRALKANGCWSCLPLLYLRYLAKIWGFVVKRG